jgi:aryl-alcohol dehydrogenase-like predicted oxidoreductase
MEKRQFGKTDMQTSVLGFGSSEIGYSETDQSTVDRLLNTALDRGMNVVDTAECYMEAESLIGNSISHRREEFYIFTKVGHSYGVETGLPDWHPDLITGSIEHSLKRLKTDRIDLLQIHSCSMEVLDKGDVIDRMVRAREQGKVRYIGYSGDSHTARHALEMGVFDALQTSVNIADQQCIDLLLPYAAEHHIGVVAKRPVANVAWGQYPDPPANSYAQPYWERLSDLQYPFLSPPTANAVEVALRFTLSQLAVCTAIVGTTRLESWIANAETVAKGPLSDSEIAEIRNKWSEVAGDDWEGKG